MPRSSKTKNTDAFRKSRAALRTNVQVRDPAAKRTSYAETITKFTEYYDSHVVSQWNLTKSTTIPYDKEQSSSLPTFTVSQFVEKELEDVTNKSFLDMGNPGQLGPNYSHHKRKAFDKVAQGSDDSPAHLRKARTLIDIKAGIRDLWWKDVVSLVAEHIVLECPSVRSAIPVLCSFPGLSETDLDQCHAIVIE